MNEVTAHASDHTSSSTRLFEEIRSLILSGELSPGSKVTESDLARRFGVNRAPLREALLRLEERRLIERFPFSGTRVFQPSNTMLFELYEIRESLEGLACRLAVLQIKPEELDELQQTIRSRSAFLAMLSETDAREQPTIRDFHTRIADISGNKELRRILDSDIWHYLRANYRRWVKSKDKKLKGAREHERIIEAIAEKDGDLAEYLMRRHIRASREAWEQSLKS